MQKEFKQYKSGYNQNETETLKVQIEAERQKAAEAQEDFAAKLQEKTKEIEALKKEQHELQSTIQKLENSLRDFKREHDSKITEYSKEIKKYKRLSDSKNEDTVKAQEAMMQVSAELQQKEKERLVLEQSHNKVLCEKQNIEKQLQEWEDFKHLQAEKKDATKKLSEENTALQDKITSLLQEKECAIKILQDDNDMLKTTNEELNNRLAQLIKEPPASPLSPIKYKTHVCVCMCMCMFMYVCMCVCVCMYVCMCVYVCVCMCMYVCVYVCVCVCSVYVCVYAHMSQLC